MDSKEGIKFHDGMHEAIKEEVYLTDGVYVPKDLEPLRVLFQAYQDAREVTFVCSGVVKVSGTSDKEWLERFVEVTEKLLE